MSSSFVANRAPQMALRLPAIAGNKAFVSTPLLVVKPSCYQMKRSSSGAVVVASLGGPGGENRKKLTREEEPEEYWSSERERKGESPFKDPLALIGILAIMFPFIFLAIAMATGLVDVNH